MLIASSCSAFLLLCGLLHTPNWALWRPPLTECWRLMGWMLCGVLIWMPDSGNGLVYCRGLWKEEKCEGMIILHNSPIIINLPDRTLYCTPLPCKPEITQIFFKSITRSHPHLEFLWILIHISWTGEQNIQSRTLTKYETQHALTPSPGCPVTAELPVAMELRVAMKAVCSERW